MRNHTVMNVAVAGLLDAVGAVNLAKAKLQDGSDALQEEPVSTRITSADGTRTVTLNIVG
jgi:hypothetical protein